VISRLRGGSLAWVVSLLVALLGFVGVDAVIESKFEGYKVVAAVIVAWIQKMLDRFES
jgi:hypothetical protein